MLLLLLLDGSIVMKIMVTMALPGYVDLTTMPGEAGGSSAGAPSRPGWGARVALHQEVRTADQS